MRAVRFQLGVIVASVATSAAVSLAVVGRDATAVVAPKPVAGHDFNGDGFADLAVATQPAVDSRTFVSVLYGGPQGLGSAGAEYLDTRGQVYAVEAGDVDGDGYDDLVVGAPLPVAGVTTSRVLVYYGSRNGLGADPRVITEPAAAHNFGLAVAVADLNADGLADIAVGDEDGTVNGTLGAGRVYVYLSASAGQAAAVVNLTPTAPLAGTDHFGHALAVGDLNGDTIADLAISEPRGLAPGTTTVSGSVTVVLGGANFATTWTRLGPIVKGAGGVPGTPAGFEQFGQSLAFGDLDNDGFADLAIGTPLAAVGAVTSAGTVTVVRGAAGGLAATGNLELTQDTAGIPDVAEINDRWGQGLAIANTRTGNARAELLVGSDGESVVVGGVLTLAGVGSVTEVQLLAGGAISGTRLFQGTNGVPGVSQVADGFGFTLGVGDYADDGIADVAISAPYEQVGSDPDGGAVTILRGGTGGLSGTAASVFTLDSPGVPSRAGDATTFGLFTSS